MKDPKEQRRHTYTVLAIIGAGGVALLVVVNSSARSAAASTPATAGRAGARGQSTRLGPHSLNFGPNPAQPQLDESLIAAREAALGTYDQSAVAEKGILEQYLLGENQDQTAQAISENTNATQLKETGLTTAAQQAIASEETAAEEQAAQEQASVESQYAQAQQTQSQGGFWGSLLGGLGSIFPFLGFNAPTGSGVGYVDSTGLPVTDPFASIYTPTDPYGAIDELPDIPPIDTGGIGIAQPGGFNIP